jgi:asparaginyl-tRNA synthetase
LSDSVRSEHKAQQMSVAMATRPLRLVKPYSYALFSYLNASTPKPSFLRPFSSPRRRLFCTATLPSGAKDTTTNKVPQFRKKLKVSDVKNDQFDSLGNTLVLQGWVRTLRLQSSVSFLEVNSIHRLNLSISLHFLPITLTCIAF